MTADGPSADGAADREDYERRLAEAVDLVAGGVDGRHRRLVCALAIFDRLAIEDPTRPEPRLGEAVCELGLGRPRRARQALAAARLRGLGAAAALSPEAGHDDAWSGDIVEAEILLELAEHEAARMVLRRLDGAAVADVETLNGRLALAGGDIDRAVRHMGQALAQDAEHPPAHHLRGAIWVACGDFRTALNAFDRAITLDAEAPAFRLSRARARLGLGDVDGALADLAALEAMVAEGFADPVSIAAARKIGVEAEAARARAGRIDDDGDG